jgi:hypothetical protein
MAKRNVALPDKADFLTMISHLQLQMRGRHLYTRPLLDPVAYLKSFHEV